MRLTKKMRLGWGVKNYGKRENYIEVITNYILK